MTAKFVVTILSVFAAVLFAANTLTAQESSARVVYLNAQEVVAAHPQGQTLAGLQEQAQAELEPIAQEIQAIQQRAQSQELSQEERGQYDTLVRSYEAVSQRWNEEFQSSSQPVIEAVNQAIAQVAQESGYAIVLDGAVGLRTSLIVYADESLNITQQVVERVGQ